MTFTVNGTNGLTYPDNTTAATGGNVTATGAYTLPVGTTGQRPGTPATGMTRYNSTTNNIEIYNGITWSPYTNTYLASYLVVAGGGGAGTSYGGGGGAGGLTTGATTLTPGVV